MLARIVVRIIRFSIDHARLVVALGLLIAALAGVYTVRHFRITSDINALLPDDLGWRQREHAFERAFGRSDVIEIVVEAPTAELTGAATARLTKALAKDTAHLRSVSVAGGADFFAQRGLLFQSIPQLERTVAGLIQAAPLIDGLSSDPSLRGLIAGLQGALRAFAPNPAGLDGLAPTLNMASDTLEATLKEKPASFSWRALAEGGKVAPSELRGFIEVHPVLDFSAVQPGHEAIDDIRKIASGVAQKYRARVRLTGPVAMDDEQFGAIKENALRNGLATGALVIFILWLALRSARLIAALCVNLVIGLAITAALGLLMVGAFNLISVYFAVLFVGIGVDFSIQYSVRYRAERFSLGDLRQAITTAGFHVAAPLTLAALATAAGFLSFVPTDYRGVSELGMIAGVGMLVALATCITVLPALIVLVDPPGEPEPLGYSALAPLDDYLARHRIAIIVGTAIVVCAGLPLLYWVRFDLNPIDLQNPKSEAIATYLELSRDPATEINAIQTLAPSLARADAIAARVAMLPVVSHAVTLSSFIPDGQAQKIAIIGTAADKLAPAFDPKNAQPPPTDSENVDALKQGAARLDEAAGDRKGAGAAAARRLSDDLRALAGAAPAVRAAAQASFVWPLKVALGGLQAQLQAKPITRQSLPPAFVSDWVTPQGRARVSISPKADPSDNAAMRRFAQAILKVEPDAIEGPVSILEAGKTVVGAFVEAGIWAFASIAFLLWLALRRVGDVLLTLIPLALAGVVTMELTVLVDLPLNFANIIALPLLLGVGVAFKIYYIMAWREGRTNLLQTSLTRAVIFSALTTATAFGSLWFSSHPGVSSMGKLLALSLLCTLAAAVLFQPVLMGKPRADAPDPGA